MYCKKCGTEISDDNSNYCPKCGQKLADSINDSNNLFKNSLVDKIKNNNLIKNIFIFFCVYLVSAFIHISFQRYSWNLFETYKLYFSDVLILLDTCFFSFALLSIPIIISGITYFVSKIDKSKRAIKAYLLVLILVYLFDYLGVKATIEIFGRPFVP